MFHLTKQEIIKEQVLAMRNEISSLELLEAQSIWEEIYS